MSRSRERIGADQARTWARKLRLHNPYGKAVLLAVANYMNEDGSAWPGQATIAQDTDLSEETVVKRLKWLDGIGAIALFKTWIDENGRRNFDGRGKLTSTEIRFRFDAESDAIEASALSDKPTRPLVGAALASHEKAALAPAASGNQNERYDNLSTRVATDQPPLAADSALNIDSEQEQEEPPNPPTGGVQIDYELQEFKSAFVPLYPIPIADYSRFEAVAATLTSEERAQALLGVKSYAEFIVAERAKHRDRAVKDAHRWLGNRMWVGYLAKAEQAQQVAAVAAEIRYIPIDSPEGQAWAALNKIARTVPMGVNLRVGESYVLKTALDAQAIACAKAPVSGKWIPPTAQQAESWRQFLVKTIGKPVASPPLVPWPWPPKKDGTPHNSQAPPGQIPGTLMTESDAQELDKTGP